MATPVHGPVIKQCLIRVDICFPSPQVTLQVPLIQWDQGLQVPTKELNRRKKKIGLFVSCVVVYSHKQTNCKYIISIITIYQCS